jgi:hypothetical protein
MNAPLVVLAVGSIGLYLNHSALKTYLSIDGGRSWKEVFDGTSFFEIGDRGRVLVIATDSNETDSVSLSIDGGLSWSEIKITNTPFRISGIATEP